MSRQRRIGCWEPADGSVTHGGVPRALFSYHCVVAEARFFFMYLCSLATRGGIVDGVSQLQLASELRAGWSTIRRWTAELIEHQMIQAHRHAQREQYSYVLRPPSQWAFYRGIGGQPAPDDPVAHEMGRVTAEELARQLGSRYVLPPEVVEADEARKRQGQG